MARQYIFAILVFIVFFSNMTNASSEEKSEKKSHIHYEFELSDEQKAKLIKAVSTLKTGDSLLRVKGVLWKPTVDQNLFGKEGDFIFRILDYYVARVEKDGVNNNDQLISIYFDKDDHLVKIDNAIK